MEDGAQLKQVVNEDWSVYLKKAKESWGDYVTLIAICQLVGASVVVVTR